MDQLKRNERILKRQLLLLFILFLLAALVFS
jgi:hypothetical protein